MKLVSTSNILLKIAMAAPRFFYSLCWYLYRHFKFEPPCYRDTAGGIHHLQRQRDGAPSFAAQPTALANFYQQDFRRITTLYGTNYVETLTLLPGLMA
jgi:hypothetical protein